MNFHQSAKKLISKARVLIWTMAVCAVCSFSHAASAENRIIDRAGKTIIIKKPFSRIISLYGAHTENLFHLGLDDEIIGVSRHESHPENALSKPVYSQRDDPEKFLAARPDLVLIRPMIGRAYPRLVTRLEKSGITVVSLQPGNIDDMYGYWKALGRLTGREARAAAMVSGFQTAIEAFRSITQPVPNKKRVYFEAIHRKMKTFTPDAMAMFVLETAGGINVAHDADQVRTTNIAAYGKERILSHASEIDVFLAQTGAMNAVTADVIKNEPGFQVIKAVRENRIHLVDETKVSRPTFRMLLGIYEIGTLLYPDLFKDRGRQIVETAGKE